MNQINLEKLLIQSQSGKVDAGSLKLLVAQVYQAQVQQLSDGSVRLQLPQPGGPLQITLAAEAAAQIQPLLALAQPAQSAKATTAMLLQFQPLADGRIQLTLHNNNASVSVPLNSLSLRQLLLTALPQLLTAPAARADLAGSPLSIAATLQKQPAGLTLHIANLPSLTPTSAEQQQLTRLLSHGQNKTAVQLLLQLPGGGDKLSLQVTLPSHSATPAAMPVVLKPASQQAIVQQLVRLVNQQQLTAQAVAPLLSGDAKLNTVAPGHSVQLHWPATGSTLPQLQIIRPNITAELVVSPQQFNRPVQLSLPVAASSLVAPEAPPTTSLGLQVPAAPQAALQQAWRQLLPLLPVSPAPLDNQPELPAPLQQIFALIRQSQVNGSKVWPAPQLQSQLAAALAFQPMQTNVNPTSSSGSLAVAIQLLLGQLLQKPVAAPQTTAQMARFVSQLDPAQAGTALRQLASHSSTLQQSQLATLDSGNNQQLILQLPLQLGQQTQFCQLTLEQREADGKQQGEKRSLWQLTMRFDLHQYGSMLVVAKLAEQQLQLQFYTEQLAAKQQAERFLPILKDRCKMQGIKVEQAECVLGKIPDTLVPRANSLLAIKA
ncbi:MAG: flagellar hook-length control protein FliK [Gammaproteobacteria bacterium]|nr:flagellar hook-length control protein FliK [Gammaproteobacteria bacterium]MBU1553212.1 flagellar hook-length control protein FliK [Gammaproteobacteria bacterium]MBU2069621.1 flagellar hook-length control protein FliK [Gammaproteobacteria bacterium]MBU2184486.1 flagellar hook-length control protein FliK [Gammaproteobacteria bacterium]MBU2205168.1 flagellar hook-length control protein FliK [Gammaproteobacteria bacterium]